MEQTGVCPQYIFSTVLHIPSPAEHATRPTVSQPRLELWEEMDAHVFQPYGGEGRRNIFVTYVPLFRRQVGIEVSGHQKLFHIGLLADGRNYGIYGRGVVCDDISPHNVPPLTYLCQLKYDNVWTVEASRVKCYTLR